MFNFDRVVYRLYKRPRGQAWRPSRPASSTSSEFVASQYVRAAPGRQVARRADRQKTFEHEMGRGHQAYLLNLRRPIFQDRRVREALDYTHDFEKINLYNMRVRAEPLLELRLQAKGPDPGELAILEPFPRQASARGVRHALRAAARTTRAPALRDSLKKARTCSSRPAGRWTTRACCATPRASQLRDGISRDAGRPAVPQRDLGAQPGQGRHQRSRSARSTSRTTASASEAFDFDLVTIRTPDFALPSAQRGLPGRRWARQPRTDEQGSGNYRGVKDPAVDAALKA